MIEGSEFRVRGSGFRVQGSGFRVQSSGLRVEGSRSKGLGVQVTGVGFGVWSFGFGVWGLMHGVCGLGFGVWGLGLRVWGLGFGIWARAWASPLPRHRVPLSQPWGMGHVFLRQWAHNLSGSGSQKRFVLELSGPDSLQGLADDNAHPLGRRLTIRNSKERGESERQERDERESGRDRENRLQALRPEARAYRPHAAGYQGMLSQKTSSKTRFLKSSPLQICQLMLCSPHKLTNL